MFQDLNNSSLTRLNPDNTKASPSVYSENDGSFNSEENMRWISKKITQKPFIVGKDTAEVNESFSVREAPYGAYVGEGLFSIDGYLFKAASDGNVTYDTGLGEKSAFVANAQYAQRFVSDMTHYGKEDELSADYSSFCFSEFDPSNVSFDVENWENAFNNGEPVGFVKMVFRGEPDVPDSSYRLQLTVTDHQGRSYLEYIYNDVAVSSIPLKLMVQDEHDLTPDNVRSIVFHDTDPKDYHAVAQMINRTDDGVTYSDTFIMYPVYVKKTDQNKAIITFTDIFTTTYRHSVSEFMTSSYPSTVSNLIDMDGANFQNPPTDCKTTTMPSHKYNYHEMYSGTTRQNTTITRDAFSMSGAVVKKGLNDFVFPSTVSSLTIKNDLSYYCLVSPANPIMRGDYEVPVALFTSEGSLCTDGFIIDGSVASTTLPMDQSPIESYIHYIKRNYLSNTGQLVTEEAIEGVTLNDLNYWNGDPTNNFTTFYNTNIAPALSAYLNLCYDSLLDNVFFNTNADDYMNIKILGCGEHYGSGVDDAFAKIATVTATGHKYENGSISTENFETTVQFNKDITSDKYKVTKHVSRSIKTPLVSGKDLFYYEPVVETFTWNTLGTNVYRFEDPQLFLTNCIKSGVEGLSSFVLYNGHDNVTISNVGEKVALDEFLVPVRQKNDASVEFNFGGALSILRTQNIIAASLVNSATYKFLQNNWLVVFPTTLSVNKDNLSYLRGRDYGEPDKYDGLTLNYKFPCQVTDDELYMFDMGMSNTRSRQGYDIEQSIKYRFTDFEYIRVRREAFIHVNKLYGDEYKGFRECVEEVTENMIKEASGGYDFSSIPIMRNALKDHIESSQRNIFYISDDYISDEFFKTDDTSNVSFMIVRGGTTHAVDRILVHIDEVGGSREAIKDTNLDIEFSLFERHTDLCLIGSPDESSETGLRAELYKKGSGGTLTYLISDFGGWDFDQRDVEHTKNFDKISQTFVYRIVVPAGTSQTSDDMFVPQVFEFSEFELGAVESTSPTTKYIGTAGSIYNDVQNIKKIINRPAKNNLSMYSGTGLGKIRIDCIVPFKVTDCVLSFNNIQAEDQSHTQQPNVSFDVYSDDDVCLISNSSITCGSNAVVQISKSSVAQGNRNKNIGYIIINNHEVDPLNPEITTTFSGAMLCTSTDWNISKDFVYGYGELYEACKRLDTINESIISLVDRPYKNLLKVNDATFYPTLEVPDLIIDLEYPAYWNYDYILYIGSTTADISIKIVDINDNEYGPYTVDFEEFTAAIELQRHPNMYIKNIVISTENHENVFLTNMMLCRKSDWDVSDEFVYSISALNDMI